jgi:ABC-type transporter Mla MlaB component
MIVKLPSELTLSHVAEIRTMLLPALRSGEALEIDAQQVTDVDIAGLQLLCSLHRGSIQQGTTVTFSGQLRGTVLQQAEEKAGFSRHVGCAAGCLWQEPRRG